MRKIRAGLAGSILAAAELGQIIIGAPAAFAQGTGTETIQPGGGCNTGTYFYTSYSSYSNGAARANAYTSFDGYCWGSKWAGARAIGGSGVSGWIYNVGAVTASVASSPASATPYGNHIINNGYYRNT